ncbi:MAG: hypothetical protein K2N89_13870 [Lachnospiraceae bacterium]|nr:hypothetical protein [Lachnospiraceae bacterium]
MINENKNTNRKSSNVTETFTIQLTNPMLYDRLHILSLEYSISIEFLVNAAIKRLINDVDFIRNLRANKEDLK